MISGVRSSSDGRMPLAAMRSVNRVQSDRHQIPKPRHLGVEAVAEQGKTAVVGPGEVARVVREPAQRQPAADVAMAEIVLNGREALRH
jgi:hypothetical protein